MAVAGPDYVVDTATYVAVGDIDFPVFDVPRQVVAAVFLVETSLYHRRDVLLHLFDTLSVHGAVRPRAGKETAESCLSAGTGDRRSGVDAGDTGDFDGVFCADRASVHGPCLAAKTAGTNQT